MTRKERAVMANRLVAKAIREFVQDGRVESYFPMSARFEDIDGVEKAMVAIAEVHDRKAEALEGDDGQE